MPRPIASTIMFAFGWAIIPLLGALMDWAERSSGVGDRFLKDPVWPDQGS